MMQYVLQRDKDDSRRAATYSAWIAPITRQANPHIKMPNGGAAAVTRKMLELAPQLGTHEDTFRVCTQAIQLAGGSAPLPTPTTSVPVPVSTAVGLDDSTDDEPEDEEDMDDADAVPATAPAPKKQRKH